MWDKIKALFARRAIKDIESDELYDAQVDLLKALRQQEYYNAIVPSLKTTVQRLQGGETVNITQIRGSIRQ